MSRLRERFQVNLPLRVLFEKPTIAELAAEIERAQQSGTAAEAPTIKAIARDHRRVRRSTLS
jgi:hypothetical protein